MTEITKEYLEEIDKMPEPSEEEVIQEEAEAGYFQTDENGEDIED